VALADPEVDLVLEAVAVHQEVGADRVLVDHLGRLDADVRHQVSRAAGRVLRPVLAGEDLRHPPAEGGLVVVEDPELARGRVLPARLLHQAVAPVGHPVMDVVGEEAVPVGEAALVQQQGLEIEELLDLHPQLGIDEKAFGYLQQL